jgi:hypothetical protein
MRGTSLVGFAVSASAVCAGVAGGAGGEVVSRASLPPDGHYHGKDCLPDCPIPPAMTDHLAKPVVEPQPKPFPCCEHVRSLVGEVAALRARLDQERAINDLLVHHVRRAEAERDECHRVADERGDTVFELRDELAKRQRELDDLQVKYTEQCFVVEAAGAWYDAKGADVEPSVFALRKEVESLRAFFIERDGPPPDPLALPGHTQKLLDAASSEQEANDA